MPLAIEPAPARSGLHRLTFPLLPLLLLAGPRACPGGPLITPVLSQMQSKLVGHPRFNPEKGHESSGRHNDASWSGAETLYFARTVGKLLV